MSAAGGLLIELRAAVTAGVAPGVALAHAARRHPDALPALAPVAGTLALGAPIADAIGRLPADDALAGPLVRALAIAETCGAGALDAVGQAEHALREEEELRRRLDVRTAQARGTLRVLAVVPAASVALIAVVQPVALRFYAQPLGRVFGLAAVVLALGARRWAAVIVARVAGEAAAADPLGAVPGGAAAVAELIATALSAGLAPAAAVAMAARFAPDGARRPLQAAAAHMDAGSPARDAFASGALAALGTALDAALRWGAPAQHALRGYAEAVRADRRAALEAAAERAELQLVFPTTLLTLPSFGLVVVPPLLWAALRG